MTEKFIRFLEMDENLRFIALLDELKAQGLVSGYVAIAELLGTNKAAISDIKGCRKKLSLDLLRSLKSSYPKINLNWVIMGEGSMFVEDVTPSISTANDSLIRMISDKDLVIRNQAEEIGRLKERNAQLEREKQELEMEISRGISPQEAAKVFTHIPTPEHQKV